MIRAQRLSRRFGALTAVHRLDLRVPRGAIFGLVGPDGAGKTTAIRLLATVLEPDAGRAWIGGLDLRRERERIKQMVGYVPQRFSLYGDLTVWENLMFVAAAFGVPAARARERGNELLRFIGLAPFARRLAEQLSGGMKQKLALACSLVHDPQVLYLDEPTAGVDPVSRRDFWQALLRLREGGATVLVSTPYMDEAARCDRIGFLYAGRLLAEGTPTDLIDRFPGELYALSTSDAHLARSACAAAPGVREATIHGDDLHLALEPGAAAAAVAAEVAARLAATGVRHGEMRPVEPSLEDVFVELVQRSGAGAGAAA